MILKVALSLLLLFSLLEDISIEGTECLSNLKNVAVYEGDQNILMNLTSQTNNVKWSCIATSDEFNSYTIQDTDGSRDTSLIGLFYPNQGGLVILNATTTDYGGPISTAGIYIAECANSTNRTGAKLLVVRAAPECSCDAPNAVQLSCTILYADGTIHPIYASMTWTIGGVVYTTDTPDRTRIDNYVFQSTSTISVDNSVPANFTCTVTFNAPTDIQYPFIATNAPEFNASCTVAVCGLRTTSSVSTTATPSPTVTTRPRITTAQPQKTTTRPPQTTATQPPATESSATNSSYSMKNIAVREGTLEVPMDVTESPCSANWTVDPTSDELSTYPITRPNCTVDPTVAGLYYVNGSGLTVRNSTTTAENGKPISTAGLYIADYNDKRNRTGAKLLVVRSGPDCSCSANNSSSNAQLFCIATFADYTAHPIPAIMTWFVNGAVYTTDAPYRNRTDEYMYTVISTITVNSSIVNNYQCILTFGKPTDIVYDWIATNAPEFNATCSTPCGNALKK